MPGHIKKSEGEDPDPDPWLVVSPELRKKLQKLTAPLEALDVVDAIGISSAVDLLEENQTTMGVKTSVGVYGTFATAKRRLRYPTVNTSPFTTSPGTQGLQELPELPDALPEVSGLHFFPE